MVYKYVRYDLGTHVHGCLPGLATSLSKRKRCRALRWFDTEFYTHCRTSESREQFVGEIHQEKLHF